jgi:hypothetical protein
VLLVDSFLATGTRTELYYSILQLPERQEELTNELGITADDTAFHAGFIDDVEFLARRWDLGVRVGYLWSISDYGRPPGALFEDPLQEPLGESELIFALPNGLPAFAFVSADGQLQESWSVTRDPRESDRVARAPLSNWRRHAGALAIRDQVRSYVASKEGSYEGSLSTIEQRFPGATELSLVLEQDADALTRRALQMAGLELFGPDPIARVHEDFESPVTAETAAALLLVTSGDLLRSLDLLDPALRPLDGGTISRSVFTAHYASSACILDSVLENQPNRDYCP